MNTLKKYWAIIIAAIFMTLISCASFFAGYKVGQLHNTVKWPENISISSVELAKDTCISLFGEHDNIGNVMGNSLILDSSIEDQTFITDLNETYVSDIVKLGGSFKMSPSDGKPSKVINLSKYVDTVKLNKHHVLIGDMDTESNVIQVTSILPKTNNAKIIIDSTVIKLEQDTITIRDTAWFEINFDMPYTTIDLTPYLKDSAFKIELTHLGGIPEMYSDTININAYPIESFKKDTAFKEYEDSTGTYKIKYVYGGCGWVPATTNGQSHYGATITVYRLFPETGYQPLAEFNGTYVEHGCFEDNPKDWVIKALKQ